MPTRKTLMTPDSKLRLVEEEFGIGTWTWDLETSELVWSPELFRILGLNPNTVIPTIDLYQSLVHPEDQIEFDDAVLLIATKTLEHRRFRIIRPDGTLRKLESKAHPHFNRDGKAIMVVGVIRDVTEQEQAQADCLLQKQTAKALIRLIDGFSWRAYPDGKLIETAHWTKLTGQTPQEAHDWDSLAAVHPDDRTVFRDAWREAIEQKDTFDVTIRIRLVTGAYQFIRGRGIPVLDAQGNVKQWVGHTVLIDEQRGKPSGKHLLTSAQIRASRAFLNWTGPELASRSLVSFSTIRRMEQDADTVRNESRVAVRKAFENAGICYRCENNGYLWIALADKTTEEASKTISENA